MAASEMDDGFKTNHEFDPFVFAQCQSTQGTVILVSQATGASYGFMINILDEWSVKATHCFTAGQELPLADTTIVTLECGEDGKIVVRPGWGD